jgi:hypothetical protein
MNFQFNSLCSYLFPRARPTGCDGSSTAPVSGAVDSPLVIDRGMWYVIADRRFITVGSHPDQICHATGQETPQCVFIESPRRCPRVPRTTNISEQGALMKC